MAKDLDDANMSSSDHNRSRSRSGSRRRRRSEHRRKSVAFAPKVQVRPVKSLIDMEDEELECVWYSGTELARMRRREEKLIESLSYMEEEDREVLAATYGLSGDILERKQARVWRVRGCRLAVLSEQECLWEEESSTSKQGSGPDHCTETLRNFSLAVSSHCAQEAQDRALDIFREVVYQMRLDRSRSGVTGGPLEAPNSPARVSAERFLRDQASGILSSPSLCRPQKQIRRKLKLGGLPSSPFPQSPVQSPVKSPSSSRKSPVKEVILRRGNLRWSDTGTVASALDPGMMLPFRN